MSDQRPPLGDGRHPELFALLRGELTNDGIAAAGRHLDECAECREELAHLTVGHALLSRASRTLRTGPTSSLGRLGPQERPSPDPAPGPAPDLPRPLAAHRARRPRSLPRWGLVAAGFALVGGIVTTYLALSDGDPKPPPPPMATSDLTAVSGSGTGDVSMADHNGTVRVTIHTHGLPRAQGGRFYYAWLFDPDTQKMLPLGQVGPTGEAAFEIPDALVTRYSVVDVSLETDDGDPGHSVTSVLRGDYSAPIRS